jgi:hypothetical protein
LNCSTASTLTVFTSVLGPPAEVKLAVPFTSPKLISTPSSRTLVPSAVEP